MIKVLRLAVSELKGLRETFITLSLGENNCFSPCSFASKSNKFILGSCPCVMVLESSARLLFSNGAVQQRGAEARHKQINCHFHQASNIQHFHQSVSYSAVQQDTV